MKKIIGNILLIISIVAYIVLILGMINVYINGFGSDYYTGSAIEIMPKRYGIEALKIFLLWNFSLDGFGIIWIPIYIIAFLVIVLYIKNKRRNKENLWKIKIVTEWIKLMKN